MGLLNAISFGNKVAPVITQAPVKQSWWRSLLTSMNATEDCVILVGGKKVVHKVPQFFWIHNAIQWAYNKNRVAKSGVMGALEKAGVLGAKMGFRFLQLPLVKSVSPLMQGNLLFSLFGATISSIFKLATGNVTGAVHDAVGTGTAIAGTAALAKYIPLALGMNPVTGWAAAIGFGITMFVEPKIRKMMGLDREPNPVAAQNPAMNPSQLMQQLALAQNPYQASALQGLQALSGGTQPFAYPQATPYGYYGGNPYAGMAGYGSTQMPYPNMPQYNYTASYGSNPAWGGYYHQQQQIQQQETDQEAARVLANVTSQFSGLTSNNNGMG